jgi:hypothetical protein
LLVERGARSEDELFQPQDDGGVGQVVDLSASELSERDARRQPGRERSLRGDIGEAIGLASLPWAAIRTDGTERTIPPKTRDNTVTRPTKRFVASPHSC